MARKPNYDFQKHRKELDRKAQQAEKLRRKREKASSELEQPATGEEPDSRAPNEPTEQ